MSNNEAFDTPNLVNYSKNIIISNIRNFFQGYIADQVYHSQVKSPTQLGVFSPHAIG